MRATKSGVKKTASKKAGTAAKVLQRNDSPEVIPEQILPRVQEKILAAMEGIIDKLILRAEEGKYADAKFLFQFAGVGTIPLASEAEARVDAKELAERFLREITGASNELPRSGECERIKDGNSSRAM